MTRLALIILGFLAVDILAARCDRPAHAEPDPPRRPIPLAAPRQAGPLALFAVGEGRWVWITRRKDDAPIGATPEFVGAIYGEQAGGFRYEAGWTYMHDIPGATATIWPTFEPSTETPTPEPTQTPWVIVVTATPEPTQPPTETAVPTATGTPNAAFLPVVVRPRVRR